MYSYCLHTAVSCENIFFLTKIWLLPLFPWDSMVVYWLTLTKKKKKLPWLPPCPDVIRPCTGDPSAVEKAHGQGSLLGTQLHSGHHTCSGQLQMDGRQGEPQSPVTAGPEAGVQGSTDTREERTSVTKLGQQAQSGRMPLKNKILLLLPFWGVPGRQHSWWLFL